MCIDNKVYKDKALWVGLLAKEVYSYGPRMIANSIMARKMKMMQETSQTSMAVKPGAETSMESVGITIGHSGDLICRYCRMSGLLKIAAVVVSSRIIQSQELISEQSTASMDFFRLAPGHDPL